MPTSCLPGLLDAIPWHATALRLGMVVCLTFIGGCKLGPDYTRPALEAPAAYKEMADWKPAEPAAHRSRGPGGSSTGIPGSMTCRPNWAKAI